jgi:hypothetical protein
MSLLETRGGRPRVFRASIPTTGRHHRFEWGYIKYIQIYNTGSNVLHVFFREEDYDNDVEYLTIANGEAWEGPADTNQIWLKAISAATDVEIVLYHRLG